MAELLTKSNKSRAKGLLGAPHDELRLRIHGPRREGQVVVIRAAKCTIGADDSCHLPLHGPGIKPIHCLILRGQRGAVVRGLAPGTTLNGMQIQDATLFTGDRLRIGPYELEVLPNVAPVNRPKTPANTGTRMRHAGDRATDTGNASAGNTQNDDLAAAIENRITRIEGQLSNLQQQHGEPTACDAKIQEIKLAQEAISSLSRQLDCERERHGTTLDLLVVERDRLAGELADATHTASSLCRELEQVRHSHVEADATSELYSQRMAEISELQATRIADVSAEVSRLAAELAETSQHHQQARDQWQANKETLEQRLNDSVNQLTQLEQEFEVVRRHHQDAEAQRHLQGSQSEELRESVRALNEQLADQQRQQAESQATWVVERRELEAKFQQLEELHRQASISRQTVPAEGTTTPAAAAPLASEDDVVDFTPPMTDSTSEQEGQSPLSLADLDAKPRPTTEPAPLHLEDTPADEQAPCPLVSKLDQLKASRVAAEQRKQADRPAEFRPYDAFNDLQSQMMERANPIEESAGAPSPSEPANFGAVGDASSDCDQDRGNEVIDNAPSQPAVSERDQLFERLNTPHEDRPEPSSESAPNAYAVAPISLNATFDPVGSPPDAAEFEHQAAMPTRDGVDEHDNTATELTGSDAALVRRTDPFGAPNDDNRPDTPLDGQETSASDAASCVTGAPVTAADVLARMGQLGDVMDDEPVDSQTELNAPDIQTDSSLDPANDIGSDDESIEAYMNQLLARARGGDETPQVEPPRSVVESSWKVADEPIETSDDEIDAEPKEYLPRSQAPEQTSNLSAMRELANDTTRSAIATHAKKSGIDIALAKMIAAGGAVGVAGLAFFYGTNEPILALLGGSGALAAATFWSWQAFRLKRQSNAPVRNVTPATIGAANHMVNSGEPRGVNEEFDSQA